MKGKLGDIARLRHILQYSQDSIDILGELAEEEFLKDYILKLALQKLIENIGEASARITEELKQENKQIDWRIIVGIRNILIHEYFGVDYSTVYYTIKNDFPKLRRDIEDLINKIENK